MCIAVSFLHTAVFVRAEFLCSRGFCWSLRYGLKKIQKIPVRWRWRFRNERLSRSRVSYGNKMLTCVLYRQWPQSKWRYEPINSLILQSQRLRSLLLHYANACSIPIWVRLFLMYTRVNYNRESDRALKNILANSRYFITSHQGTRLSLL